MNCSQMAGGGGGGGGGPGAAVQGSVSGRVSGG